MQMILSCFPNQNMVCRRCLDKLSSYTKKWQMKINIKKTKAIIFNKSGGIFRGEYQDRKPANPSNR